MIRAVCLSILLAIAGGLVPLTSSAAVLLNRTVFTKDEGGYKFFRIPAIVRATNGDLLAFAEGRVNSKSDTGNIDIVMKRSTNDGRDWQPLQVILNLGDDTAGNPVPIVDQNTGDVVLLVTANYGEDTQDEITKGTGIGGRYVFAFRSVNHGASFGLVSFPDSSVKLPGVRWFATGPGHGIQLKSGPHAGRLVAAAAFNSGSNSTGGISSQAGAQIMYSDDRGVTWSRGAVMFNDNGASYRPSESMAAELTDGTVYVNSRNRGDDRAVSYIDDSGEHFVEGFREPQLIDPAVEGSVVRMTRRNNVHSLSRLLFANPATDDRRRKMTVRASYDESETWTRAKMVYRGEAGYSDMVLISSENTADPYVGLLYESGVDKSYERISFARFNRTWLETPQLMQLDFRRISPGAGVSSGTTLFDSKGNAINGKLLGNGTSTISGSGSTDQGKTALWFSGDDDLIRVSDTKAHAFDFEAEDSFTLEAVFGTPSHSSGGSNGSGPLISKDVGSNQPSYWLRIQDGKLRFFVDDGVRSSSVTSSVFVSDNRWRHVAAVRDAQNHQLRLYVDYRLVGTANDSTTGSFANDNHLMIGGFNASSPNRKRYRGYLNWARVSMEALSVSQMLSH